MPDERRMVPMDDQEQIDRLLAEGWIISGMGRGPLREMIRRAPNPALEAMRKGQKDA